MLHLYSTFHPGIKKHFKNSVQLSKMQPLKSTAPEVRCSRWLHQPSTRHQPVPLPIFNFFFLNLSLIRGKDSGTNIWLHSCLTLYLALLTPVKSFLTYTSLGGPVGVFCCNPRNGWDVPSGSGGRVALPPPVVLHRTVGQPGAEVTLLAAWVWPQWKKPKQSGRTEVCSEQMAIGVAFGSSPLQQKTHVAQEL